MVETEHDPGSQVRLLAQEFPCLWNAPHIRLWNAVALDHWATEGRLSHGERCSVQFLLSVWDPNFAWKSGAFNIMEALRVWDVAHRQAFLGWAADPWWA